VNIKGGGKLSKQIKNLKKGSYRIGVRGWRKVGTKIFYSAWSGAKTVKVT
jgi:hypothetical protein